MDVQGLVVDCGNGVITVRQNDREETYYLSRFARFDWLPNPGDLVSLKLDKRNFVREIRRIEKPTSPADELAQVISTEMAKIQNQDSPTIDRLTDPDFLLRVFQLASQIADRDFEDGEIVYWADLILEWIRKRSGGSA